MILGKQVFACWCIGNFAWLPLKGILATHIDSQKRFDLISSGWDSWSGFRVNGSLVRRGQYSLELPIIQGFPSLRDIASQAQDSYSFARAAPWTDVVMVERFHTKIDQ